MRGRAARIYRVPPPPLPGLCDHSHARVTCISLGTWCADFLSILARLIICITLSTLSGDFILRLCTNVTNLAVRRSPIGVCVTK